MNAAVFAVAAPPGLVPAGGGWAIWFFAIYIAAVLLVAWLSNRLYRSGEFLSEYFLGSRSLGLWAFALTFAATSASGGSFIGFPALVYTHGWAVGLWIGGYMIVPIVAMALLGNRLNQVARRTQAITLPDVLRDRFHSPVLGTTATGLIAFFMVFNLVAQFKSGSVILQSLLQDEPLFQQASRAAEGLLRSLPLTAGVDPGYLLCLVVFAAVVILYTAYGGFRAVVWTDVMQGFVMLGGVLLLLPLTLWAVGGLGAATREMAAMTPPDVVQLRLSRMDGPADERLLIPKNTWFQVTGANRVRVVRTAEACEVPAGQRVGWVGLGGEAATDRVTGFELTFAPHIDRQLPQCHPWPLRVEVVSVRPYAYGAGRAGVYLTAPGPDENKWNGFLPISLAISFYFMWTFSTAGQPSNMVRLMAFDRPRTLSRAIFTVSVYYTLIYVPLLIIFCCARVLLPGWETEPDRIMPEMARLTSALANAPWLAGLLLAAPFAAVMSTMDSFLLMISSAVVRDIYQRNFNPEASEKVIKRLTYATTLLVGGVAMLAAVNPPKFLQNIIVFTGTGLSTTFLVPVFLLLYWPRFNLAGALAGIWTGVTSHAVLYAIGTWQHPQRQITAYEPGGFHPFICGTVLSLLAAVAVTWATRPPTRSLVQAYFGPPSLTSGNSHDADL